MEKAILLTIKEFSEITPLARRSYSRWDGKNRSRWTANRLALLYVRNKIFRSMGGPYPITPSNKASFSRALRRLEEKGLIETWNVGGRGQARYSTHAWLTEKGEGLTFSHDCEKLTSTQGLEGA